MADDDYSYFDPRGDTPVGSTWGIGNTQMNPNDPLNDWASNLTPEALQTIKNQYATDPSGAVQSLIDQGHPPPDHHYTTDANGQLQPVSSSDAAALDAAKAKLAQGLGGMQAGTQTPQAQTAQSQISPIPTDSSGRIQGNVSDAYRPLGAQTQIAPGGTSPGTSAPPDQPSGKVFIPGQGWVDRGAVPQAPPASTNATAPPSSPSWWPTPEQTEQLRKQGTTGDVLNGPGKPATTPPQTKPDVEPTPAAIKPTKPAYVPDNTPLPVSRPAAAGPPAKKKAEEDDEDKPFGSKALEGFSKSLAGVKVPERKPLPPPTGLGVRSPVSVQQTLAGLLTAAGAHAPQTAPPAGLIRLLKGY